MSESLPSNTSMEVEKLAATGYDKVIGLLSKDYQTQMASFLEDFSGQAAEMMHSCHAFGRTINLSEAAVTAMQLADQWKVYIGAVVLITVLCVLAKRYILVSTAKKEPSSPYNLSVFDLAKTAYEPGHKEAVINLVEKLQYDVNFAMPSNGLSLFLCSCLSGNLDLIWYMMSKGADIDSTTRDGDSALYLATYGILNAADPDTSVLERLITAGCSVNKQNNKGYTPLHRAGSRGNIKIIRCLLQHGADPYLYNNAGIFPIDSAINSDHLEAAKLLQIRIASSHVWDVVDPHTPPRISLGLRSPQKKHLAESSRPRFRNSILT